MFLESSQGTTLTRQKSRGSNRMRKLITVMASVSMLVMALVIFPESSVKPDVAFASCYGSTYVSGYFKSNGTYVSGHYRTCPDRSLYNNYYSYGSYSPRAYTSSSYSGYGSSLFGSSGYVYGSIFGGR